MKNKNLKSLFLSFFAFSLILCLFTLSASAAGLGKISKVKSTVYENRLTLSWSAVSKSDAYQIFELKSGKWKKIKTVKTTKVSITGLSPSTEYSFKVRAYKKTSSGYIYSPYSSTHKVKTKLPAPKKPEAAPGNNYVKISWPEVKNATGYQVAFYDYSKKKWVRKKQVSTNSATISSLTSVKSYKFKVRAFNKKGTLVYSPYSEVTYFTTKPNPQTGLKVKSVSADKITLTWDKVSRVTGYYIYVNEYSKEDKATSYKVKTKTSKNSITLSVKCATYYRFRVMPYYRSGSKNLYGKYATSSLTFTPVGKINSFTAADITNTGLTLLWETEENVTGYYLYKRDPDTSKLSRIATLDSSVGVYKVTGLKESTPYKFYIKAYRVVKSKTKTGPVAGEVATTDDDKIDSVAFTRSVSSLYVGKSYTFKAAVYPSYAYSTAVTYKSSNTSVATVSSKGVVKALSPGTTYIYAISKDSSIKVRKKLTVKPVVSKSISLPDEINLYLNETTTLSPTFTPENTTDKSFTVTGSDHSYSYKLLGLITSTDTCKFSDYITVDSLGRLTAKKITTEPHTGKSFAFSVKVTANDSAVSDTVKIKVINKDIKITVPENNSCWYYGNKVQLCLSVSSSASFDASEVVWSSDNTSVATVSSKGLVNCVGYGNVTITVSSPDGKSKDVCELYVSSVPSISKTYYEACTPGSEYTIDATVLPNGATTNIFYVSTDPTIASVDTKGNVSFLKEGTAAIMVSTSDNNSAKAVYFTSGSWTAPDCNDEELFSLAVSKLNDIKSDMPAFVRTDSSVFSNFYISDSSSELKPSDFEEMFAEFAAPSEKYVSKVDITAPGAAANQLAYYNSVPVAGSALTVIDGIDTENDIKDISFSDKGGYTYDIKFTLESEAMPTPSSANSHTAHGKVFDILTGSYINNITSYFENTDMSVSYGSFSQLYNNSSVTLSVNKATGKVDRVVYDMNIDINIKALDISYIISLFKSDLSFSVNNKVELKINNL